MSFYYSLNLTVLMQAIINVISIIGNTINWFQLNITLIIVKINPKIAAFPSVLKCFNAYSFLRSDPASKAFSYSIPFIQYTFSVTYIIYIKTLIPTVIMFAISSNGKKSFHIDNKLAPINVKK